MGTLKDIEYAVKGEQPEMQEVFSQQEEIVAHAVNDANLGMGDTKYHIFKLVDTKKKGGTYIPNVDDVINPQTGKVERIRLLAGVDSIWVKDQKNLDAEYIRQNSRSIAFPPRTKVMRIPDWDKTALEFARICRHNIGSPNRKSGSKFEFFEYDPAKQAKEALEREELELEMAHIARQMDELTLKKYVSFVKIPLNDEIGELKTSDMLKRELMLYAKRNPYQFKELVNSRSKEIEIAYLVKKAVLSAKIDIGSQPGRAFWANGGGLIGVIPTSRQPIDYLTELALTNTEEGRTFQEQLKSNTK